MSDTPSAETKASEINFPKPIVMIASAFSYVFHPIFMPIVMALVLFKLSPVSFTGITNGEFGKWILNIGITTLMFPLFSIALLKPLGFISSFKMPTTKERIVPLMITMTFYFWVSHVFENLPNISVVPMILKVLLLGNFWGIVLLFLINIFTKVSFHTAAAGGMIGNIIVLLMISPVDMEVPFFISLVIAGIIGTARMILKAHQKGDIWLGYIVGIAVQLAAYFYLKL